MKREELIQSKEYWIAKIQIDLFNEVESYMKANNITRAQFAEKLGVSKGYVSQILNGEADHRISKLVELALSIGLVPSVSFEKIQDLLHRDKAGYDNISYSDIERSKNILANLGYLFSNRPVSKCRDHYGWESVDSCNNNFQEKIAS
ncbi:MAG: helix-turn-helix transcriptional regulator [Paludibacteraceae bacterium]|jgi:transcriptional regulator with XRE-family HTH domain|nr:helix-turn-helix transcriptional regulator [Paludibacteraceae bacterium]HON19596.1 helix-turn-helix domain-containing protein [Salinivirgaceae bacterium]